MDKKRNQLYRDMRSVKTHYKAYKAGKRWLVAGISIATFGSFLMTSTAHADTVSENTAITAQTSTQGSSPAAVSSTSAEPATTGESTTSTTTQAQTQATTGSASDASQTTVTTSATADLPVGTTTSTGTDGSVTVDLPAGATSAHIAAAKQAVVASGASVGTVTAKDGASADVSGATTSTTTPASDSDNVTIDSMDGQTVGDTTMKLTTPQDFQDNFVMTGSQKDAKTSLPEQSTANMSLDTETGEVLLTNRWGSAGAYAFGAQIDATQSFELQGEFKTTGKITTGGSGTGAGGGGLGIILQPVNPDQAGVNGDPGLDIGIVGQPNTTFIGRDFYNNKTSQDSDADVLIIRQTDGTNTQNNDLSNFDKSVNSTQAGMVAQSSGKMASTDPIHDEYFDLKWTPNSAKTDANGKITGTMTYTTYSDAAHQSLIQTVATDNLKILPTTAIAAFGAIGGGSGSPLYTRAVTLSSFALQAVTEPVTVKYVGEDGAQLGVSTLTAKVGDTISIAATSDAANNVFAPKAIEGYSFNPDNEGSKLSITVANPNVAGGDTVDNTITIYYSKESSYLVQPTDENGDPIGAPIDASGLVNHDITSYPDVPGYTVVQNETQKVPGTPDTPVSVTYLANATTANVTIPSSLGDQIVKGVTGKTAETVQVTVPAVQGYHTDQQTVDATVNADETITTTETVDYIPNDVENSVEITTNKGTQSVKDVSGKTGDQLTVTVPTVEGYTPDATTVTATVNPDGTITTDQTVNYTPNTVTKDVIIGTNKGDKVVSVTGQTDQTVTVDVPAIDGYQANTDTVTATVNPDGTITTTDQVTYTADTDTTYIVTTVDGNQNTIGDGSYTQTGTTDAAIRVPNIAGYTAEVTNATISGDGKTNATVVYTPNTNTAYKVIARDMQGNQLGDAYDLTGTTAQAISVPTIAGYTAETSTVTINGDGSTEATVIYKANTANLTIAGTTATTDAQGVTHLTFGDTPELTATLPNQASVPVEVAYSQLNADGTTTPVTGTPTHVGTYLVQVTPAAEATLTNDYGVPTDGISTGTLVIDRATVPADDAAKYNVTVTPQTIDEGQTPASFTAEFGNLITSDLSASDFVIANDGQTWTNGELPQAAGTYQVKLTDEAQARITAAQDYVLTADNFTAGNLIIRKVVKDNDGRDGSITLGTDGKTVETVVLTTADGTQVQVSRDSNNNYSVTDPYTATSNGNGVDITSPSQTDDTNTKVKGTITTVETNSVTADGISTTTTTTTDLSGNDTKVIATTDAKGNITGLQITWPGSDTPVDLTMSDGEMSGTDGTMGTITDDGASVTHESGDGTETGDIKTDGTVTYRKTVTIEAGQNATATVTTDDQNAVLEVKWPDGTVTTDSTGDGVATTTDGDTRTITRLTTGENGQQITETLTLVHDADSKVDTDGYQKQQLTTITDQNPVTVTTDESGTVRSVDVQWPGDDQPVTLTATSTGTLENDTTTATVNADGSITVQKVTLTDHAQTTLTTTVGPDGSRTYSGTQVDGDGNGAVTTSMDVFGKTTGVQVAWEDGQTGSFNVDEQGALVTDNGTDTVAVTDSATTYTHKTAAGTSLTKTVSTTGEETNLVAAPVEVPDAVKTVADVTAAQTALSTAVTTANQTETAANITAVDDALSNLKDIIDQAQKVVDGANDALDVPNLISGEKDVRTAMDQLTADLTDPTATVKTIHDDADALNGLVKTTQSNRNQATDSAQKVIDEIPSGVAENADVLTAKTDLDSAIKSGTIEIIATATETLTKAIKDTGDVQAKGRQVVTAPVSQEQKVQDAQKALTETLTKGTVAEINDAITALQTAVSNATEARNNATDAAGKITSTIAPTIASNAEVNAAKDHLDDALSNAEDNNGTTEAITEMTGKLRDAIDNATDAYNQGQVALQMAQPVNNEAGVAQLAESLTTLLNAGTTADINQAIVDLNTRSETALAGRNVAVKFATTTQSKVSDNIAENADVVTINETLSDQIAKGTTAGINAAAIALQTVIESTTAAKQNANTALKSQGTVANEPSVAAKANTLTNLLATGATADIVAATEALTTDINQATYSRATAISTANAITIPTDLATNTTVTSAQDNLQTKLNSGTTSEIMAAATTLTNAITAATLVQTTATAALDNVAPVGNEGSVQTAVGLLQTALTGGTTAEITKATEQITTAVQTAQAARTTAINDAMNIIVPGNQVANEEVKTARETLNTKLADGTTDDINIAATQLANAVQAVTDAKTTANTALGNLGDVANEATVQKAVTGVTDLLTTGTADAIEKATTTLQQATNDAKKARNDASTAANAVQVPTELKANQDVKQASDKLTMALTTGTTDDIAKATTDLNDAISNTNQALTTAKATLTGVGRVANEQPIAAAMGTLMKTFTTGSTDEINVANDGLTDVLKAVQSKRDTAITDATAVTIPTLLKASADVIAAQTALTTALQVGTTAIIEQATADLNTAIAATGTAQTTGQAALVTANATTLTKETGVANALTQLAALLENGTATATELTQATQHLATEIETAENLRTTAIDTAEAVTIPTELAHHQDVLGTNDALISAVTAAKHGTGTTAQIEQATIALQNVIATAQNTNDVARAAIAVTDLSTTATTPLVQSAKQQLQTLLDVGTATIAQLKQATTNLATAVETARTTFTQSWSDGAISTIHIADNHDLTVTTVTTDGTRTTTTIAGGNGTADGLTFVTPADGALSVSKATTVAEGQLVETLTVPRTTAITSTTTLTTTTPATTNITVPATTVTTTTVTPTGDTTVTTVVTSQLGKQGQVVATVAPEATTATVVLLPDGTDALTATDIKRSIQSDGAQVLALTTPQADGSELTQQLIIQKDGTVSYAKTAKYTDTDANVATVETNANGQLVQLTTYDAGTKQAVVVDAAGIAQLLAIADRTGSQTVAGFTITKADDGSLAVTWAGNSGTTTYAVGTDDQGNFAYTKVAVTKDTDGTTVVATNLDADVTSIDKTWNDQSKTNVQVSQRTTAIEKLIQQLLQDKGVLPTTTPEQAAVSATAPTQHLANDVNLDYDAATDSYVLHKATDPMTNYHTAVTAKHGNVSDSKNQLYQTNGSQTVITTQLTADGAQLTQADTTWLDGSQSTIQRQADGTYQLVEQTATGETKATDLTPGTTVTSGTLSFTATPDGNVAGVQTAGDTQLILGADAAGNFTANQVTTVTNNGNTTKVVTDDAGTPIAMSQTWSDGSQTNLTFSDPTTTTSPLTQLVQNLLNQIGATAPDAIKVADDAQQVGGVLIKRDGNKVTLSKVTAGNVETSASVDQETGDVLYQETTLSQPEVVTETVVETVPTASTEQAGGTASDGLTTPAKQANTAESTRNTARTNETQSANNDPKVKQLGTSGQAGSPEFETNGASESNGHAERMGNTEQLATDGEPSLTAQTDQNAAGEAVGQGQLPQTDDQSNAAVSMAGLGLLAGLAGALGLRRKRRED